MVTAYNVYASSSIPKRLVTVPKRPLKMLKSLPLAARVDFYALTCILLDLMCELPSIPLLCPSLNFLKPYNK